MKKTHVIYLLLSILFFISGVVFLIISVTRNLTEFSPLATMFSSFTQLRYYELFLKLAISALVCFVCFFIIWAVSKFTKINAKVSAGASILVIILFCCVTIPAGINAYANYSEKGIYTDISQESYQKPDTDYLKFFPYIDSITEITDSIPYYSLNEYRLNGSVLRTSQIFNGIADKDTGNISITTDYFESDKKYMMSKYRIEKAMYESFDENGDAIVLENIRTQTYKDYNCLIIPLETEKRFIVPGEDFYFTLIVQDDADSLKMSEEDFINLGTEQFELFRNATDFEKLPNLLVWEDEQE